VHFILKIRHLASDLINEH